MDDVAEDFNLVFTIGVRLELVNLWIWSHSMVKVEELRSLLRSHGEYIFCLGIQSCTHSKELLASLEGGWPGEERGLGFVAVIISHCPKEVVLDGVDLVGDDDQLSEIFVDEVGEVRAVVEGYVVESLTSEPNVRHHVYRKRI